MKTVADSVVLQSLEHRLRALKPESRRRWGTLTPHEMLCHLGDATAMVLGIRPRQKPVRMRRRPFMKWVGLWAPIRWPHGLSTNPMHNPRVDGTRPSEFAADLERAIAGIKGIAAATDSNGLESAHGVFGIMTVADWQRWAYRHTDHHLRQFGL